jgi:hypothetical protein
MYRKSSFCSQQSCVEVDCECTGANWRKSSKSNPSGNCVEFGGCSVHGCRMVHIRDTKNPGVVLDYPRITWSGGLSVIFELVHREDIPSGYPTLNRASDSWWKVERNGSVLYFDDEERIAFLQGAVAREFASA